MNAKNLNGILHNLSYSEVGVVIFDFKKRNQKAKKNKITHTSWIQTRVKGPLSWQYPTLYDL